MDELLFGQVESFNSRENWGYIVVTQTGKRYWFHAGDLRPVHVYSGKIAFSSAVHLTLEVFPQIGDELVFLPGVNIYGPKAKLWNFKNHYDAQYQAFWSDQTVRIFRATNDVGFDGAIYPKGMIIIYQGNISGLLLKNEEKFEPYQYQDHEPLRGNSRGFETRHTYEKQRLDGHWEAYPGLWEIISQS